MHISCVYLPNVEQYLILFIYQIFIVHASTDRQEGWFNFLVIVNADAVDVDVQVRCRIFGYLSWNSMPGSYCISNLAFLEISMMIFILAALICTPS